VFIVSFCIALVGVAILVIFVQPRAAKDAATEEAPRPSLRQAMGLVHKPQYRALLLAGGALSLATASDAFIFLALQDTIDLGNSMFPLLFVGSATTYMLLAVPMGRLADQIGRGKVLLGGYVLLLTVYLLLLSPLGGWGLLVAALGLLGMYYAATDGVLMALGSAVAPDDIRGSGLALLRTVTSGARFAASLLFGLLWTLWGIDAAFGCFAALLIAAMAAAALILTRTPEAVA
jgi:MFS family permease